MHNGPRELTETRQAALRVRPASNSVPGIICHLCLIILGISHFLLPAERGFPLIRIADLPLTITLAATLSAFSIMLLVYGRIVLRFLVQHEFIWWQLAFALWMAISCLLAGSPKSAYALPITYVSVFVLNYLVFATIIQLGLGRLIIGYMSFFVCAAAAVGLFEGLAGYQLPWYAFWSEVFRVEMGYGDYSAFNRVSGTLGNPIIFGALLIFTIPWVLHIKMRWLRVFALCLVVIAAFLTLSRTVLLVIIPLFFGEAFIYLKGIHRIKLDQLLLITGTAVLLAISTTGDWQSTASDLLSDWTLRMGDDAASAGNLQIRVQASKEATERVLKSDTISVVAGFGGRSSIKIGTEISESLQTLDNTYTTILYEFGVFGLMIYIISWARLLFLWAPTARTSLHWANIVAVLSAGVSFVTCYYSTINLPVAASLAFLGMQIKRRAPHRTASDAKVVNGSLPKSMPQLQNHPVV